MQDTKISEREKSTVSLYDQSAEAVLVENSEDEDEHLGWSGDYDISVIPNDFNVSTLCDFLDKGAIIIPEFQRDYVWDRRKASRFIESIALGLPVPELFFYQIERNKFWVVDGQQRLLSIYFFRKGRFPRIKEIAEIGGRMRQGGEILPKETWEDNSKFSNFTLDVKSPYGGKGDLYGLKYEDVVDRIALKPLRSIVVRQHSPDGFNSAFEIFDRLNTGGSKLTPQQIRASLFRSRFLDMVDELNRCSHQWHAFLGDKRSRDPSHTAQIIVRVFAMLSEEGKYAPGMARFLNNFCRKMQKRQDPKSHEYSPEVDKHIKFLRDLFCGFLFACKGVEELFRPQGKLQITLFEAVFVASISGCFRDGRMPERTLSKESITRLIQNERFEDASKQKTSDTANVAQRLKVAREIIPAL